MNTSGARTWLDLSPRRAGSLALLCAALVGCGVGGGADSPGGSASGASGRDGGGAGPSGSVDGGARDGGGGGGGASCTPRCAGRVCGPDGCGGTCGACPAGRTCYGDGQCGAACTPKTCSQLGAACGSWPDGCGGTVRCPVCTSGFCAAIGDGPRSTCQASLGLDCDPERPLCGRGERCLEHYFGNAVSRHICVRDVGGQDCRGDGDCAGGADFDCSIPSGVCEAPCGSDGLCLSGERCRTRGGGLRCVRDCAPLGPNTCGAGRRCALHTARGGEGPMCLYAGEGREGDPCTLDYDSDDCAAGLLCVAAHGGGRCLRFCDATHACGEGRSCHPLNYGGYPDFVKFSAGPASGFSACASPCELLSCTTPNRTTCVLDGATASCGCDAGLVDDGAGQCTSATPCDPNPCTGDHRTTCTDVAHHAECSCDPGYVDDGHGGCADATPCEPNPCVEPLRSVCTPSGTTFTCACDPGAFERAGACFPPCAGGDHDSGDAFEPNECAEQAAALPLTAAGTSVLDDADAAIGPDSTDVDFYAVPRQSRHVYWPLLAADAAMCSALGVAVPSTVSTRWTHAAQAPAGTSPFVFSCARQPSQAANPTYTLAALDFDLTDGAYSSSQFSPTALPAGRRHAAGHVSSSGTHAYFSFRISQNVTLSHTGQSVSVRGTVRDPGNGSVLANLEAVCLLSLTPARCASVSTTGEVEVQLDVSYTPERAVDTPSLTAWRLDW